MNILHLVHQYPPEFVGGTELYAQTLAREQVARGHRVTVIFPSLAKPAAAQFHGGRGRGQFGRFQSAP